MAAFFRKECLENASSRDGVPSCESGLLFAHRANQPSGPRRVARHMAYIHAAHTTDSDW